MASTIQSTSAFSAGDLALLSHDFNVADDGLVTARFNFACLGTSAVVARNIALFQTDARPPVALPSDLAALRLDTGSVYLLEKTSNIQNGICYISATYVGSSGDQGNRITESQTTRSFSGNILGDFFTGVTTVRTIFGSISFDYTAVARTARWTLVGARSDLQFEARPINIRNSKLVKFTSNLSVRRLGLGAMVRQVVSFNTERVGRVTRVTKTVTGEYVADNDGIDLLPRDDRAIVTNFGASST